MIKEGIEKILSLAVIEHFTLGGRGYTSKDIIPVKDPEAAPLVVHGLKGIVDFWKSECADRADTLIHISDATKVALRSKPFGVFKQRETLCRAEAITGVFQFGRFMDLETFIIGLQSQFVQDTETAKILSIVGNLRDGAVKTLVDDGVSQQVNTKVGVTRSDTAVVPNPVTLRPFRTFAEVNQPSGLFVLRLQPGREGQSPTCALFEADGHRWELEAIGDIKAFFANALPDVPIIG